MPNDTRSFRTVLSFAKIFTDVPYVDRNQAIVQSLLVSPLNKLNYQNFKTVTYLAIYHQISAICRNLRAMLAPEQ